MKEYVVQRLRADGRWCDSNIRTRKNVFSTEAEARKHMGERQKEFPFNRYRIAVRTVTEWEEVK